MSRLNPVRIKDALLKAKSLSTKDALEIMCDLMQDHSTERFVEQNSVFVDSTLKILIQQLPELDDWELDRLSENIRRVKKDRVIEHVGLDHETDLKSSPIEPFKVRDARLR